MATALLEIRGDASGVRRMLGEIEGQARSVAASISRAFRESDRAIVREARAAGRDAAGAYASMGRARAAATEAGNRAERRATVVSMAEARTRSTATNREAGEAVRAADHVARAREGAERRVTATTRREVQARVQAVRDAEGRLRDSRGRFVAGGGAATAGREGTSPGGRRFAAAIGTGVQVAGAVHGAVQDARARRAESAHTMNAALYQAGAGATDAAELRRRAYDFAQQHGLDSGELAGAMNASQTEFSTLGNSRSSQRDRRANMETFLQSQLFARNTGQNGAEVARVQGLLANSGLDSGAQRSTLLALTGMSQRGAIELGAVTRTAMAPLQARMAQALIGVDPNDAAARAHAQQQAVLQTFAEMEVGRGLGMTPRALGNITTNMGTALNQTSVQGDMLHNIRNSSLSRAQRERVERQLFVRDSHGRSLLRGEYRSTMGLARGLTEAGLDSTQAQNVFAGTGQGNRQSLQANYRRTVAAFMGEGNDNVARMMAGAGSDFTESDVKRGAGLFGTEDKTELTRNRETHDGALDNNTSALNKVSNALAGFVSKHPILAAALPTVASAVAPSILSRVGTAAGGLLRGAGGGLARVAGGAAGVLSDLLRPSNQSATGGTDFFDDAAAIRAHRGGASGAEVSRRATVHTTSTEALNMQRAVQAGVEAGMRNARVGINPADAAAVARDAGASGGQRPREAGQ